MVRQAEKAIDVFDAINQLTGLSKDTPSFSRDTMDSLKTPIPKHTPTYKNCAATLT